ncbi:MAG: hypothetical protein MN733_39655, partial [Nitrososphaera sp.]|nr:hypothetical protein [Nitrososphaera sp.]
MKVKLAPLHCPCGGAYFTNVLTYDTPPKGETKFPLGSSDQYRREVLRCDLCAHFVSIHDMDTSALYTGEYVSSTYGENGIRRAFERIVSLDPTRSDNVGRVQRILEFATRHFSALTLANRPPSVLDVGSGLCVFLYRMKAAGWDCT